MGSLPVYIYGPLGHAQDGARDQNLGPLIRNYSCFGMGVPGWVLFQSTSMDPWVMPRVGLEVKI